MLEAWGDIERRHIVDISVMKDYLHAVVCIIPLIEGAKVTNLFDFKFKLVLAYKTLNSDPV